MHFRAVTIQRLALWGWGVDLKFKTFFSTSVLNQSLFLIKVAEFLILNSFFKLITVVFRDIRWKWIVLL